MMKTSKASTWEEFERSGAATHSVAQHSKRGDQASEAAAAVLKQRHSRLRIAFETPQKVMTELSLRPIRRRTEYTTPDFPPIVPQLSLNALLSLLPDPFPLETIQSEGAVLQTHEIDDKHVQADKAILEEVAMMLERVQFEGRERLNVDEVQKVKVWVRTSSFAYCDDAEALAQRVIERLSWSQRFGSAGLHAEHILLCTVQACILMRPPQQALLH